MANMVVLDGDGNPVEIAFPSGDGSTATPFAGHGPDILTQLQAIVAALGGTLTVDDAGGATAANQATLITALGDLLTELQAKANLSETQPTSLATLPDTAAGDLAAIRAAGVGLTDAQLRDTPVPVSLSSADPSTLTLTITNFTKATSGDTAIVAAPAAGNRLVVHLLEVQNESATETTVLWKEGATTKWRAVLGQRDGFALQFDRGKEWRLPEATALNLNLSGANAHGGSVVTTTEAV